MELSRDNIKQTKGLAILSMILLHLFCRKGADVYGTPLLWVSADTPLVYYLGFLSEICVPMYCLCSGYAHYRLGQSDGLSVKRNAKRGMVVCAGIYLVAVYLLRHLWIGKAGTLDYSFLWGLAELAFFALFGSQLLNAMSINYVVE